MIFCARATRGLRKPSLNARSGRSLSPHSLRRERASLEGTFISFDARSKGQPGRSSIEGDTVDEVRQVGILLSYTDWEAHEETARS